MAVGLKTSILNGWLTGIQPFYVKLHTGDPGAAGTANAAAETTREEATFAAAAGGAMATDADLVWTSVAATETYTHVSFWTASSGGTFVGSALLALPRSITAGGTFTIAAGNLAFTITPQAS